MYKIYFAKFHMKSFTLAIHKKFIIIFEVYKPTATCNVFNRSTSREFVAQHFRKIFPRRSSTHSNTLKSVGSLWAIDQLNSKVSA
jgi:hypothetical protein